MEVLQSWDDLSAAVKVKLLFLLDSGDVTSHDIDDSNEPHVSCPTRARDAFLSVLHDRHHNFAPVTEVVKERVKHLQEYLFISLAAETPAADYSVRKDDEDLLTLVHVCRHLHVKCRLLEDKIKKVQEKLSLTKEEMEGNFFIYTENLRMLHICENLTACQVMQLLATIMENKTMSKFVARDVEVEVSAAKLEHTEGLKEVLFFYLIRTLELNNKLNRIYTNKLESLLEQLQTKTTSEAERRALSDMITSLGDYPRGGRPTGHCVVFCVTRGKEGAKAEIEKVKRVFGESLGYTIHVVENPNKEMLQECLETLQKPKYKFYDSIVYWFMSHGSGNTMKLADGNSIKIQVIIENFSRLANFRKKPKLFFMASCQVTELRVKRFASLGPPRRDVIPFMALPEECKNITAVYYQMDRLVVTATLSQHYAFQLPDGGLMYMYVDMVCRLMEQHRGHNITNVLERVTNTFHQEIFSHTNLKYKYKQACCYTSTFQKIFRVP